MSAAHPFDRGDYSLAALTGAADDWRTWAAFGLIGRTDRALAGLARFDHAAARFHLAVSLWMAGDDDGAVRALARLPGPRARRLLALIEKPRIEVLTMMPSADHRGPLPHLAGIAADAKFSVVNIGTGAGDSPARPYADLADHFRADAPPDLFVVAMIEWRQLPPDLAAVPATTIGVTSDFDVHIQGVHPWFGGFDALVVNDHDEFAALTRLTDRPIASFPLVFGRPVGLPEPAAGPRDIDLFMSGTLFSPYHPDKAACLHRALDVEGLRAVLVNGHLSEPAYHDLLARSRATVCYYRRPGGMVTRGIEAACSGCVTLVQEGSALTLYADPPHGLVSYRSTPEGLAQALAGLAADFPTLEAAALAAAPALRRRFAPEAVASRFFRFCAYLAGDPRRRPRRAVPAVQKRNMFWKGWLPGGGDPDYAAALRRTSVERLRAAAAADPSRFATAANDGAREMLLDYAFRLIEAPDAGPSADLLPAALDLWRTAIAKDPDALAARFNFIRAALHFGDAPVVAEALELAGKTLSRDPGGWRIAADDDLLPYDFAGGHFDYRSCFDLLSASRPVEGDALPPAAADRLRDLVLASVRHYLARFRDDPADAARAAASSPDFAPFLLDHARHALRGPDEAERKRAIRTLSRLASSGFAAAQAHHLLRRARGEGAEIPGWDAIDAHARRVERTCVETEAAGVRDVGGYFPAQLLGPGNSRGERRSVGGRRTARPLISAVVVDGGADGGDGAALARSLARQTLAPDRFEVLYVDLADDVPPATAAAVDVAVACGQDGVLPHRHRGFNAGLRSARAPVVCLIDRVSDLPAETLAEVAAAFAPVADGGGEGIAPSRTLTRRDGGHTTLLACRRLDALLAGGCDQHESRYGAGHDLGELACRLTVAGAEPVGPPPERLPSFWPEIWPHLADPAPRRRPFREAPGLFALGLAALGTTAEGRALLERGLDLALLLARGPGVRRSGDRLEVDRNAPVGPVLRTPATPVPPGRYEAVFAVVAPDAASSPRIVLDGGADVVETAVETAGGATERRLSFAVVADGGGAAPEIAFGLTHPGKAGWRLEGAVLRRLPLWKRSD